MGVHFWPHTDNPNIASFRLRCLCVMEELRDRGLQVALYRNRGDIPEKLVLSKRYDAESINSALLLKKKYGTKIYLDLCDNHFFYKTPAPSVIKRADQLRQAIEVVDTVVTASGYLAEVVRAEAPTARVSVIGDLVEPPKRHSIVEALKHPFSFAQLQALHTSLNRLGKHKNTRLVWFGNHGSGYVDGGMSDLETIRPYLENLHRERPISLTIISNSRPKYQSLTKEWKIPTFYLPWNKAFFSEALNIHGVSVIPIQQNPFTMAKTCNRVTTSLVHGLNVIADPIPSYVSYENDICLGEWERGLYQFTAASLAPSTLNLDSFKEKNIEVIDSWLEIFREEM